MTKRITPEQWTDRAQRLNLMWVGPTPKRNDEPTEIRCLDCGYEWKVFPANIAKGQKSCEPCARSASRVSPETWRSRLFEVNAVWVDGTPSNNSDKTKFARCNSCQLSWKVDPRRISIGHPLCKEKLGTETISKDVWSERAAKKGIEWLEIPIRSKIRTPARCLSCKYEWSPIPDNITGGSGCPKCAQSNRSNKAGRQVSPKEWENRASKAGVRWKSGIPKSTSTKTPVVCLKCSHSWSPLPSNITKGAGCPRCAKNAPQPQSVWDERASKLELKWLEPVKGRHSKTRVVCLRCNHEWSSAAGAVAQGAGCPKCGMQKAQLSRRVDSETWIQRAASKNLEWIELPTNNSTKKAITCNSCKYVWSVIPQTLSSGAGCPVCSGVVVEEGTWEARAAALNMRWLEIPTSARRPSRAECLSCGLIWKPNPGGVTSGSGCPDCAEYGYKVGSPGLFYLVERGSSHGRPARKIGISNLSSSATRLLLWKKQGFELNLKLTHDSGQLILNLEQNLLKWLRFELNIPPYLDKEEMPKGGETETFSPDEPPEEILIRKIQSEFLILTQRHSRV